MDKSKMILDVSDKPYSGDRLSVARKLMKEIFRKYMASDTWKELRQKVIQRDEVCQNCGTEHEDGAGFTIHHTSYDNWGYGNYDEMEDLVLLCRGCHLHADHSHVPFFAKKNSGYTFSSEVDKMLEDNNGAFPALDVD